jgi:outer membrane cobalamin receptor
LLWLLAHAFAADPATDLAEEADLQFQLGVDAYRRRDWAEALEHLLASNRLVPNRNVVFNIGRAYEQMGRFDEAWRHYADYLVMEDDAGKRRLAEEAVARIGDRVALLRVVSDPPGATIYVDRRELGPRGTTPRVLALPAGPHRVFVEKEGWTATGSDAVTLTVGGEVTSSARLDPVLAEVRVEGGPAGAEVRLDDPEGEILGHLPATLAVPPGPHLLVVTAPGHRPGRYPVQLDARTPARVVAELARMTGSLVVDAPERGALIEMDGRAVGFAPTVLDGVPEGDHAVRVTLAGFRPWAGRVQVPADGSVRLMASLVPLTQVTAASRRLQSVEDAPASVTVIEADELRAFGDQTVVEALSGARGVFTTHDRTYESLGIRGFGRPGDYNTRTLVTLDGHALNDDQLGASYLGHDLLPDLLDVERIELVRGPGSALYGTGAFFGVINLVTREREGVRGPHVSVASTGERGVRGRVGAGGELGEGGGYRVGAGGVYAQGADFDFGELGVSEGADGFTSAGGTARAWKGDFSLSTYANTRDKRIPTGAFDSDLADPRAHSEDTRAFAEGRWDRALSTAVRVTGRAFADHYSFAGAYPYGDDTVRDAWTGTWLGGEARVQATASPWLRLLGGGEADVHATARLTGADDAGRYLDEQPSLQVYSAYAVAEADAAEVLTASLGARLDVFSTFGSAVNPRVAIIARPGAGHTVKLLGGTAFRAPSPYELVYNDGGTSQVIADALDPERIQSAELEYDWRIGEVATATAAVFGNRIEGLIDLVERGDGLLQYRNTEAPVLTVGTEVELRRSWRNGWMAGATGSLQRTRTGDLSGDGELTNSPPLVGGIRAAAPVVPGAVTGATRLRVESGRLMRNGDRTDPAVVWDLIATGLVPALGVAWGAGVKNVLDWRWTVPGGEDLPTAEVAQPGRTVYGEVTVGF